jgi:hypothetical protein
MYSNLLDIIKSNLNVAVPKTKNNNKHKRITVPYWTDKCQTAINKRKAAEKLLQKLTVKHHPSRESRILAELLLHSNTRHKINFGLENGKKHNRKQICQHNTNSYRY